MAEAPAAAQRWWELPRGLRPSRDALRGEPSGSPRYNNASNSWLKGSICAAGPGTSICPYSLRGKGVFSARFPRAKGCCAEETSQGLIASLARKSPRCSPDTLLRAR